MSGSPFGPVGSDESPALLPLASQQAVNVAAPTVTVTSSSLLAHGKKTAAVSTAGTTFGTGVDLLASTLSFTSDGTSDYIVNISAPNWTNTGTNANTLSINLDGADAGTAYIAFIPSAGQAFPLSVTAVLTAPAAGAHTLNVRMFVSGGTATVNGGAGGAATNLPLLVTIDKAA